MFLLLVAPNGRRTMLLGAVGQGSFVTNLKIVLDAQAPASLPQTVPPFWTSGTYKPANYGGAQSFPAPAPSGLTNASSLAIFNGGNPNGTWRLFVKDADISAQFGEITNGWSLRITAQVKIRIRGTKV